MQLGFFENKSVGFKYFPVFRYLLLRELSLMTKL